MKSRIVMVFAVLLHCLFSGCAPKDNRICNQVAHKIMGEVWNGTESSKSTGRAIKICLGSANVGDVTAQYYLSILYTLENNRQENEESYKWTLLAANNGHVDSQYHLGVMYEKGIVIKQNSSRATEWYQKAAQNGSILAQLKLGYNYTNRVPKDADFSKGIFWYEKAAEQGNRSAIHFLINFYSKGTKKFPADKEKELYWIDKYRKIMERKGT